VEIGAAHDPRPSRRAFRPAHGSSPFAALELNRLDNELRVIEPEYPLFKLRRQAAGGRQRGQAAPEIGCSMGAFHRLAR
jgi:hypothetical protein